MHRLIEDCHDLLAPGGRLIVGHFNAGLPANERVLLEWLMEWPIVFRSEEAFRRILADTAFGADRLRFEHEPLGVTFLALADRAP